MGIFSRSKHLSYILRRVNCLAASLIYVVKVCHYGSNFLDTNIPSIVYLGLMALTKTYATIIDTTIDKGKTNDTSR
jgi:hypothetical protein